MSKLEWIIWAIAEMRQMNKDNWPTFTEETRLTDLDIDSLDIVELQMMYEEQYNIELSDIMTKPIVTVGDLIEILG